MSNFALLTKEEWKDIIKEEESYRKWKEEISREEFVTIVIFSPDEKSKGEGDEEYEKKVRRQIEGRLAPRSTKGQKRFKSYKAFNTWLDKQQKKAAKTGKALTLGDLPKDIRVKGRKIRESTLVKRGVIDQKKGEIINAGSRKAARKIIRELYIKQGLDPKKFIFQVKGKQLTNRQIHNDLEKALKTYRKNERDFFKQFGKNKYIDLEIKKGAGKRSLIVGLDFQRTKPMILRKGQTLRATPQFKGKKQQRFEEALKNLKEG